MKPYSLDLRQKIIETYEQEAISQRNLAKRFRVALSFIYKLLKLYREKGTFEPKSHGGGQSMKLSPENICIFRSYLAIGKSGDNENYIHYNQWCNFCCSLTHTS